MITEQDKDKLIATLTLQLQEKEEELNDWKDGTIICKLTDAENKVKDLEHQLVEKEELIMFADRTIKGLALAREIDKISFAVEQLEKVKNGLMRYAGAICNEDGSIKKYDYVIKDSDFEKHIDNQIEELKRR